MPHTDSSLLTAHFKSTLASPSRKNLSCEHRHNRTSPIGYEDPSVVYQRCLAGRRAAGERLQVRERFAGRARIAAFFAIIIPFFFLSITSPLLLAWVASAIASFLVAAVWHGRIRGDLGRNRRAAKSFERGLDRLNDRWVGRGPAGERYVDATHPYSSDLDLFGRGSLFQYVCEAHTPVGQDTLAAWLMQPAEPEEIRLRQTAIAELRPNVDLREILGVLGDPDRPELKTRALLSWPQMPAVFTSRSGPITAIVLALLGLGGIIAWILGTGPSPLLIVAIVQVVFVFKQWSRIRALTRDARAVLSELEAFLPVLRLVEQQRFESPWLRLIHSKLVADGEAPSTRVANLARLLDALDTAMRNQFVLPLAFALMIPMHLVYAIERWRRRDGAHVRGWLEAVGSFEALTSLSALAYEHPSDPFAEITDAGPVLEANEIAHPLLPASKRIANDLSIGAKLRLLLVSGSNMSGKSTLMRALGLNVVLALAGAPVCASRLRVSPMLIATAMRQADSLQEGVSAFYAEVRRLQAIREWTKGPRPVLFLLDEILRGTNSHDRRIGAEAVIAALLENGAIGMVSTHDLALAEIVDRLGDRAANVHFEDQVTDGRMTFDYRLRSGVVPRGNGLVMLRLLGFEV